MKKLSQHDIILWGMLNTPNQVWFSASDFQSGEYFVGYEASARISELCSKYPMLIKRSQAGKFRVVAINWDDKEEVEEQKERIQMLINLEQ